MTETETVTRPDELRAPREGDRRSRPRVRVRFRRRPAALGALAVVLATGVAFTAVQTLTAAAQRDAQAEVIAVARQAAVNLLTINPTSSADALERLGDGATGEFKQQLVAQGDHFTSIVSDANVDSTGTISEAGIRSLTDDAATVLVSAVGMVKNTLAPDGQPRQYRMVFDLQRAPDTGRWLVAKLEFAA